MKLADPELLLFAGGECLEKYGTLFKRTRQEGEALEVVTAPETRYFRDRLDIIRAAGVGVPTVDWIDYDGTGRRPVLITERGETQLCEFSVPGGTPSDWELQELDGVTNLAGEYGVQIDVGDSRSYVLPANWDPDDFEVGVWLIPAWDSVTASIHYLANIRLDGDNEIQIRKPANSHRLRVSGVAGGVAFDNAQLDFSPGFDAGDVVFCGVRVNAGTLTIYIDTDGNNVLETDAVAVDSFDAGSYTLQLGHDEGTKQLEGAINLLITNDGSTDDAIQDRFNAGEGMALKGDYRWLARHGEDLVLHVGGNGDGSLVQADSRQGATDLLEHPDEGEGAYSFDDVGEDIDFGAFTESDGAVELAAWGKILIDEAGIVHTVFSHWDTGTEGKKNWRINVAASDALKFAIATDGVGGNEAYYKGTLVVGTEYAFFVRFKGDEAVDADKVQMGLAAYDANRQLGAWSVGTMGDASTPATLRTPTAVNLTMGRTADGSDSQRLRGEIDDLRLIAGASGTVPSIAQLQAEIINEPNPALWAHWWPMDDDAQDQLGSLHGSVTGAVQVADGRHHYGRFERWVKQGQLYFDGASFVDFGAFTETDGQSELTVWGVFTPGAPGNTTLLAHWDGADSAGKSWRFRINGTPALTLLIATDGVGGSRDHIHSATLSLGTSYRYFVRFKGDEVADSDKVQIGISARDPATGLWGAWTTEQVGSASTPATIRTPASTTLRAGANSTGGALFMGLMDELRLNVDTALSIATLEAGNIYSRTDADWDHAWDFDGDGDDQIGALDGGVTGAIQWYDGRQPEGWGFSSSPEIDRATGANQASEATYGTRLTGQNSSLRLTSTSLAAGRWIAFIGDARETAVTSWARLQMRAGGALDGLQSAAIPTQGTMAAVGIVSRADNNGTVGLWAVTSDASDEAYFDNLRAYEFATVSPSVETKGSAFPLLNGFGGPSGVADAALEASPAAVVPMAYDAAIGTNVTRLDTGPAGTHARSYRFGLPGQLNGLTPGEWVSMAVGIYIPSSEAITPASVTVAVVDSAGETVGTAAATLGGWNELYVSHQVDAGASEAYLELRVHDGEALGTVDESLFFRTPTIVARKCRPRPFANAAEGTVSMSAEIILREWLPGPTALAAGFTVYGKVLERGVIDGGEGEEVMAFIGTAGDATANPRFVVIRKPTGGKLRVGAIVGSGNPLRDSVGSASPVLGEVFEWAARFFPDGSVQLLERVAGGATLTAVKSDSAPLPIQTAWSGQSVVFGGSGQSAHTGFVGLIAGKVAIGTEWDLDQLDAADAVVESAV